MRIYVAPTTGKDAEFAVSLEDQGLFVGVLVNGVRVVEFAHFQGNPRPTVYITDHAHEQISAVRNYDPQVSFFDTTDKKNHKIG